MPAQSPNADIESFIQTLRTRRLSAHTVDAYTRDLAHLLTFAARHRLALEDVDRQAGARLFGGVASSRVVGAQHSPIFGLRARVLSSSVDHRTCGQQSV